MTANITYTTETDSFCGVNQITLTISLDSSFAISIRAGDPDRDAGGPTEATDEEIDAIFADEDPNGRSARDVSTLSEESETAPTGLNGGGPEDSA